MFKLKNYIELNPKEHISKGEIVRQVTMADLEPFSRDIKKCGYVKYKSGTKFRNGDTLLARITPCLENGKTSFVNFLKQNEVAVGSTEFYVLRAIEGKMDPNYLYYLSISKKFRKSLIKSMTGTSGRQRATKEAVLDYDSNIPDFDNQKSISHKLSLIDDMISVNNQINDNLLDLISSIWENQSADIHNKITLKRLAKMIITGKTPSTKVKENYGTDIPFVKIPDMRNKVFIDEASQNLSIFGANSQKNKYIPENSIIVSCIGTPGLVSLIGRTVQTNQQINSLILDNKYIYCTYLELKSLKYKIRNLGSGGTTIKNLNKTDFGNIRITVPNKDGQLDRFNRIAKPIFEKIHVNNIELQNLVKVKEVLLGQYF